MVHPVPAPLSVSPDIISRLRLGGRSQKLMLLSRGKLMSGAPICIGIR